MWGTETAEALGLGFSPGWDGPGAYFRDKVDTMAREHSAHEVWEYTKLSIDQITREACREFHHVAVVEAIWGST